MYALMGMVLGPFEVVPEGVAYAPWIKGRGLLCGHDVQKA